MSDLICMGDLHLRQDARQPQRLAAWDQAIREGEQRPHLGGWVLAGDLFHAISTPADRNAAGARLVAMANRAPVIAVQGNHDGEGELELFARLGAAWPIYLFTRPECRRLRLATGQNVTVFGLPYPHRAALVAAGVAPGADVFEAAGGALASIILGAAAELTVARQRGDAVCMVGHATITGAVASNGQPQIGRDIALSPRHLEPLGDILQVFGHIHAPQVVGRAHYVGSITRQDFGELEAKRLLIASIAPDSTYTVVSVPLAGPPLWHVEGTLTREGFTWTATAGPGGDVLAPPASWAGCEVRCRYRFHASEKSLLSDALVLAAFADAARLQLEPIAVPDRALRAPEVVDAPTLAAKVEAWARVAGVTTSPAVLDKLHRLEQTDPVALLAELQTWVAEVEAGQPAAEVAA